MKGSIKIKYIGTNTHEYETNKLFNYIKDVEIIITNINNNYFLTFELKVHELNINTEITYRLNGLKNRDDLLCNKGLFSIFINEILIIKRNSILIGSLTHIVEDEERVDNFSFLISFANFDIQKYLIGDYDIWVLE